VYILDRVTGKPVFGVEERPVPKATYRPSGIRQRSRSR
jgi:glucose dehydrogenase